MKTCKRCHIEKPLDQFYNRKSGTRDGKYSYCISCTKEDQAEYRKNEENRKANIERVKKWQEKNKDKHRELNRKSSKKHSQNMDESYLVKRLKGRAKSRLSAKDIKEYPQLLEAIKLNLKIKRMLNQN